MTWRRWQDQSAHVCRGTRKVAPWVDRALSKAGEVTA